MRHDLDPTFRPDVAAQVRANAQADPRNAQVRNAKSGQPAEAAKTQASQSRDVATLVRTGQRRDNVDTLKSGIHRELASETQLDGSGFQAFGEDGLTFQDVLDVVNPLQHIPVLSTAYRSITGDTIDPASRVAGDALFFGPLGAATAAADAVLAHATGKDSGEHVMAMLGLDGDAAGDRSTAVASLEEAGEIQADAAPPVSAGNIQSSDAAPEPQAFEKGEPIPIEALPADMRRALENGETLRPSPAGTDDNPSAAVEATGVGNHVSAEPAQGWAGVYGGSVVSALDSGDDSGTSNIPAATAAGNTPGTAGSPSAAEDGGWFTAAMAEALDRYEAAAKLGDQSRQPKLNVTP